MSSDEKSKNARPDLLLRMINLVPKTPLARNIVLTLAYTLVFYVSYVLSWQLRFDFDVPPAYAHIWQWGWIWFLPIWIFLLIVFKQFDALVGFFSLVDLSRVLAATVSFSCILMIVYFLFPPHSNILTRGVILINFILLTGGYIGTRLIMRLAYEHTRRAKENDTKNLKRMAILGAGDVGASLVRELKAKRGMGMEPVVFYDDDKSKWHSHIHGIEVYGKPEDLKKSANQFRLDGAIIAMPSASPKRIGELVKLLQNLKLSYQTVPSIEQLANGEVTVSQLRDVEIEDLLGREPVNLDMDNIRGLLGEKVVMVTGAGGSIGSELCRQVVRYAPHKLLMVERSEGMLFEIEQELIRAGFKGVVFPVVADILDRERMRQVFNLYKPTIIFHAAAHKHVPMMELHPGEAIKNNCLGTALIADLAVEFQAKRFVLISTDKAINPTSVMGATKRLAELYIQSLFAKNGNETLLMAVRFGNVLGSSGSVVTVFKKQIAAGGPVTVTDKNMERYFMTIPEAVSLVLQSAAQGEGGEIFLLDMGKPVRIEWLARQMIELSGLRPDTDVEIVYTGSRPGEKLREEIYSNKEQYVPTKHPKILRFVGKPLNYSEVRTFLDSFGKSLHNGDPVSLKMRLKEIVPEFTPEEIKPKNK